MMPLRSDDGGCAAYDAFGAEPGEFIARHAGVIGGVAAIIRHARAPPQDEPWPAVQP